MGKYDHLLPEFCYTVLWDSEEVAKITRGKPGYWRLPRSAYENPHVFVDRENTRLGVTLAQEKAMLSGCIFGWDFKSADPRQYEHRPKRNARAKNNPPQR